MVICRQLGWGVTDIFSNLRQDINHNLLPSGREVAGFGHTYVSWFDWRWADATNAVKQFISGIVVTIAMTGLDQAMMQKNLACKDLRSAQKNMYMTGAIIFAANLLILLLGALLCVYVNSRGGMGVLGIGRTDEIFPMIASRRLGPVVSIFFILGLLSASFPSAAAAMTSLTGSIYLWKGDDREDVGRRKLAQGVIALLIFAMIMLFFLVSDDAVINLVYKLASYTYGPLLGLFFFGILTKREVSKWVSPVVSVLSPLICLALNIILRRSVGFDLGFSLLLVNGTVTFLGLLLCSRRRG